MKKKIKVVYPDGRGEVFSAAEIWTSFDRVILIDEKGDRVGVINVDHICYWKQIK